MSHPWLRRSQRPDNKTLSTLTDLAYLGSDRLAWPHILDLRFPVSGSTGGPQLYALRYRGTSDTRQGNGGRLLTMDRESWTWGWSRLKGLSWVSLGPTTLYLVPEGPQQATTRPGLEVGEQLTSPTCNPLTH